MTKTNILTINPDVQISLRGQEFAEFANIVSQHIENYAVPQYGDKGSDPVSTDMDMSREVMISNIKRYVARAGRSSRPHEANLDLIKIAHYACLAYYAPALSESDSPQEPDVTLAT